MLSFKGHLINRERYSELFQAALAELKSNSFSDLESLKSYQEKKFTGLLNAVANNTLGRKRFEHLYGSLDKFSTLSDLSVLGITTKEDIKEAIRLYPVEKCSGQLISHTSGTTGSGMIYSVSKLADAYQWSVWWRYRMSHGIDFDTKCGYFGGRSIVPLREKRVFYRYNRAAKQVMFSAYHLNNSSVNNYANGIKSHGIRWLHGYPSILSCFASLCLDEGIDLSSQIDIVTIGAESLLPNQKSIIEKAFSCKVVQHYGLSEGVVNISEDISQNLVVDEDFSLVDFVDVGGGSYKVLGSSFFNSATPFIKYDTGDIVTKSDTLSGAFRVVKDIDGRKEDFITLKNGTKLGRLDHIFKDIYQVKEVQLVQNDIDSLTVNLVKGFDFTKDVETKIEEEFFKRIGNQINIKFEYVNFIPRTKSGKLRFVISNLER
ncbi:phenylacetate--CoA ligase family protein [Vibrio owensii]|uniref:phenylacetate--CoA ligase family protein n=1 Tax=Vibrio owensii TaxID=696485 RepID=UPI0012947A8C|nr:phenylacetate--CoA ligase family protein [Vibrio owensii]